MEFKLKHIPLYCSVMSTSFPSLNNEGFAAMLFALKLILMLLSQVHSQLVN